MISGRRPRPRGMLLLSALLVVGLTSGSPGASSGFSATSRAQHVQQTQQTTKARALPPYSATVSRIGPRLRERMRYSHERGCPVPLRRLRYLRMSYVGFRGGARTGEMVVHRAEARDVVSAFRRIYRARFRIRRMRLVDAYRGSDARSMSANNTSAYNCRRTTGGDRWSEHAFGRAIDVNPVQNPYVDGSFVAPDEGRRYARIDRSADSPRRRGVIRARREVVRSFREAGWQWGGYWRHSKDYQHFSTSGR